MGQKPRCFKPDSVYKQTQRTVVCQFLMAPIGGVRKTTRATQWIQIGTLFLVILAAFAAIAFLVVTMSWG